MWNSILVIPSQKAYEPSIIQNRENDSLLLSGGGEPTENSQEAQMGDDCGEGGEGGEGLEETNDEPAENKEENVVEMNQQN